MIGLILGTAFGWLKSLLGGILNLFGRYPLQMLIVALLALSAWLWHGKGRAIEQLALDRAAYASAAALAQQEAQAAHDKLEQRYKDQANETDRKAALAVADMRDAADRYAATHRLRGTPLCSGPAASPGASDAAPRGDGPGEDAIVLSRADFDTLNENTGRLKAVHDWGDGLIHDGLAVKLPN